MAVTRQLKQQVTNLILNDEGILKLIAESVSTMIVEKLSNDKVMIGKIATSLAKESSLVDSISSKISNQRDSIKQELSEALSFDHQELKANVKKVETICEDLKAKSRELEWTLDRIEQYGRRNCLLFHGIPEQPQTGYEDTDGAVLKVIKEKIALELHASDLDRSHRLGRRRSTLTTADSSQVEKPRPVIVKFISYNLRADVFRKKRKLKGSGIGISESLTKVRMEIYTDVSNHANVEAAWTLDGKIIALRSDNKRKIIIERPGSI